MKNESINVEKSSMSVMFFEKFKTFFVEAFLKEI